MKRRTQEVHVAGRTAHATVTSHPAVARRWDARVDFFGYNVLSDCRKLSAHYGLRVACPRELRLVTGMGNASMESMAEQLLGWRGVKKSQRVGVSNWDVSTLSKRQVSSAAGTGASCSISARPARAVSLWSSRASWRTRVNFIGYKIMFDCTKLSAYYGLQVACPQELRKVTGMRSASMESMGEQVLGWRGVNKAQRVGAGKWDVSGTASDDRRSPIDPVAECLDADISPDPRQQQQQQPASTTSS
uniref:3'-5' exonuclease domain-containing protein n=1 Tax=Aegilops tauschii TaxID=37682 RepID=M8BUU0_AEGTA